jgi:ubiquinone/menaquinone biosynthesis C-methylase UbiE
MISSPDDDVSTDMPDLHYTHPWLAEIYDLDSPWAADTEFYLALAGSRPVSVLDLGCGTGTLCHGLAAAGHRATGVDPAAAMLNVAKSKPHAATVQWVESRAQDYRSDARFDLAVMTGHAFQVLLSDDDVLAMFETVRAHLKGTGRLAFESRNPALDWEARWARSAVWHLPVGEVLQSRGDLVMDDERISFAYRYEFPETTLVSTSTLRFMPRMKIETLLARAGFEVVEVFGDWDATAFDERTSAEMVFVARIR